ncbi:MAG: DUF222 domain-containing protein [Woeseiaceae bacterium]|nr:DUF222 domain-containing protein [Woeseiaceae bacterium]
MRPAESVVPDLVSIEELDNNISVIAARINIATYELIALIREFDERAGFLKWGFESCAEWLAWRCDFSAATAREKVRAARALKTLPLISRAFSTGELSWSKVRELTRVANERNEAALVEFALRHTSTHVTERCRELRMGDAASIDIADTAFDRRSLRVHRNAARGMMSITIDLPLEAGELVDKALDKARDDTYLEIPGLVDTSWSKRQADAFVNLVKDYLNDEKDVGRSDNYVVTVHVDQSALEGKAGRSSLPIESVKRLCCDSHAVVLTEDDKGEPLSIGRKARTVPKAIERAVRARDKSCCSFPGCRNRRFLDCHHVEHWANGGETSLDNLLLLCTRHHTLVHEGGFRIEKDFNDAWYFVRPDGVAVPDAGYHALDMIEEGIDSGFWDPPRGGLLSALEKVAQEPPAPVYWQ